MARGRYADLVHEFIHPRTGETRYCVAEWNAEAATLERPLTAAEHYANPSARAVFARRNDAGMAYLGSVATRRQALAQARRIYGGRR